MKLEPDPPQAQWTDFVLLALVFVAALLFFLALVGCDAEEDEPTCADWLVCYEGCRARELDLSGSLNECLMGCPQAFVANPLGVPAVEWQDHMLECAIDDGLAPEDIHAELAEAIRVRGECVSWRP